MFDEIKNALSAINNKTDVHVREFRSFRDQVESDLQTIRDDMTSLNNSLKVTGYRRGRGFKCGFYYPSLARYCRYGPESYSHV